MEELESVATSLRCQLRTLYSHAQLLICGAITGEAAIPTSAAEKLFAVSVSCGYGSVLSGFDVWASLLGFDLIGVVDCDVAGAAHLTRSPGALTGWTPAPPPAAAVKRWSR